MTQKHCHGLSPLPTNDAHPPLIWIPIRHGVVAIILCVVGMLLMVACQDSDAEPDVENNDTDDTDDSESESFDTADYCGDGIVQEWEECDDGNTKVDNGCEQNCTVEVGYECVVSNNKSVCSTICGDGYTTWDEECDDNDLESGDGCSGECRIEEGWVCIRDFGPCFRENRCGDGVLDEWECCDDGNLKSGDGCSARCQMEGGGNGTSDSVLDTEMYQQCVPINCGNGIVEPGEECDDGINDGSYEGCATDCLRAEHCGDGIVQEEYEECDPVDGNFYQGLCFPGCIDLDFD